MMFSALWWVAAALAEVQRFAIVVGNNQGHSGTEDLYFAHHDAEKMQSVLHELGGVSLMNTSLLLGKSRNDVLHAFGDIRGPIEGAKAGGNETVLYFFYSGHADEKALHLGKNASLSWEELEILLEKSGADVRIAFVDACKSGTMTRRKGAVRGPGFASEVVERLDSRGSVIITSSTGDEASQESNEIGGSYFTHFLASALAGTADDDADGRVTLSETYQYVYHETVLRTSVTRTGTQHPSYEWDLAGSGDVVLTELSRPNAGVLVFPPSQPGVFGIFDLERRMFVAEVEVTSTERELALRPGKYLVQHRLPTRLATASAVVRPSSRTRLEAEMFAAAPYESDVAKGAIESTIRQANRPKLAIQLATGARAFADPEIQAEFFPTHPVGGVQARLDWRDGKYVSAEFLGGSGGGSLQLPSLAYDVATEIDSAALGAGLGWRTRPGIVGVGGGIHAEGVWLRRRFPDAGVANQSLFTLAPGLEGFTGLYPGNFGIELSLRIHYLPYVIDGRDDGMAYSELLLGVGYRF